MENLFATRTVSLGIMPKEIDFKDDERYHLRSFTALDGRKLEETEFHIANLDKCQILEIISPDTDLSHYRLFEAIGPDGSIIIFQDLKYKVQDDEDDDEEYGLFYTK